MCREKLGCEEESGGGLIGTEQVWPPGSGRGDETEGALPAGAQSEEVLLASSDAASATSQSP